MGFYRNDDNKITFDEAEDMVEEYLNDDNRYRSYIKTRDICRHMDIDSSMHNKVRIHDALEEKCEVVRKSNGTRFRISDDRK